MPILSPIPYRKKQIMRAVTLLKNAQDSVLPISAMTLLTHIIHMYSLLPTCGSNGR